MRPSDRGSISILLLKYLQFRSRLAWSLSNLVALLRWNLFTYRDLWKWIDQPCETPPQGPRARHSDSTRAKPTNQNSKNLEKHPPTRSVPRAYSVLPFILDSSGVSTYLRANLQKDTKATEEQVCSTPSGLTPLTVGRIQRTPVMNSLGTCRFLPLVPSFR